MCGVAHVHMLVGSPVGGRDGNRQRPLVSARAAVRPGTELCSQHSFSSETQVSMARSHLMVY